MEHISNEEKAKDITKCLWFPQDCTEGDIQSMLVAMAEWKDKEWAERFKKAFEGLWTASFNVDNLSSKAETTIEFKLVTRE